MDLSIVIPAYNEEKRILTTLGKTLEFLQQRSWSYELLAVDDGSADRTVACIEEYAQDHPEVRCVQNGRNRGKGFSVRHGIQEARGKYIGFMDGDYKTDIAGLDDVMPLLEKGRDGVIGDRTLGATEFVVARKAYREWGSKVFRFLLGMLMGLQGFGDTQCGFKFFQVEVVRDLFARQKVDGFMFDVEILMLANKQGYQIDKIPVKWTFDPDSRFNPVTGTIKNFKDLARIRWMHR
jgi:dolichyl-phosphate beta-glucosyltransferase|tara:strand:- start:185 stop:892 length:708 start_codon:yes stop_codon:yes gene_type:complete